MSPRHGCRCPVSRPAPGPSTLRRVRGRATLDPILRNRRPMTADMPRRPARRARFDVSAVGHPLWWGSLAVLVANDHLLKGRGVVPSWLTGKLSDFAFLIVAPVLAAALLPRALRGR